MVSIHSTGAKREDGEQSGNETAVRLLHCPGVGWIRLPPRNTIRGTERELSFLYRKFGEKEARKTIRSMFSGLIQTSIKKHVEHVMLNDRPSPTFRKFCEFKTFRFHPEEGTIEFKGQIFQS